MIVRHPSSSGADFCSLRLFDLTDFPEHVRHSWRYAWLDNGLAVSMEDRHWTRWLGRG